MPARVLFGDEPYIIDKKVEELIKGITYPETNLSYFDEFNDALKNILNTYPLMDEKRLVVLTLDDFKCDDTMIKVMKNTPDFTELVIVSKSVDKRSTHYKILSKENMIFECCKLTENQLKKFVLNTLDQGCSKISNSAYGLLIQRLNYFQNPDVSLYTVEIFLKQLMFLNKVITDEEIYRVMPETSQDKLYALSKAILTGKADKAFSLALDFIDRGENTIGMLTLLHRVFKLAYKASLYDDVNKAELGSLLGVPVFQFQDALSVPEDVLSHVLDVLQDAINGIKSGRCDAENMFLLAVGSVYTAIYPSDGINNCRKSYSF